METLPTHWLALVGVVFMLGLKHGVDPDPLAAIDGLPRFNAGRRPLLSRWSGLLFSAGHGVVVTTVAIVVATVAGIRDRRCAVRAAEHFMDHFKHVEQH